MTATEAEFLADPLVCQACKDWWMKFRVPKGRWVCPECAKLIREAEEKSDKQKEVP